MDGNENAVAKIAQALTVVARGPAAETSNAYVLLAQQLHDLESLTTQSLRSHESRRPLMAKLKSGSPLTADEMQTLRMLVIGDADQYLKYDEEFDRTKSELAKIMEKIGHFQSNALGAEALMQLRVLCQEAASLLAPTTHYLEQKERISRFEEATKGPIDRDAAKALIGIIEDSLG
jgi:hypothetical protein